MNNANLPAGTVAGHLNVAWGTLVAALVCAALILAMRRPDQVANPQLWAEDGSVCLAQQRELGFRALFVPYAGYQILAQRLIALASAPLPLEWAPAAYVLGSLAVTLGVCAFLGLWASACSSRWWVLFLLAPVLVPHSGEVFLTAVNVHLVLCLLLPFLYARGPIENLRDAGVTLLFLGLIGLSGPFLLLTSPLLLLRWLLNRKFTRAEALVLCWVCLLVAVQGVLVIGRHGQRTSGIAGITLYDWASLGLRRFAAYAFFGARLPDCFPVGTSLAAGAILLALPLGVWTLRGRERRLAVFLLAFGGMIFLSAVAKLSYNVYLLHPVLSCQRYYYVPYTCILCSCLLLLSSPAGGARWLGRIAATLMLLSSATFFTAKPLPNLHWKEQIRQLREAGEATIPINPAGWSVHLAAGAGKGDGPAYGSSGAEAADGPAIQ